MSNIEDRELASILIERLNRIIEHPDVRQDVQNLIEKRVQCSLTTIDHPTIQVDNLSFGFLGLLNGISGSRSEDPYKGCGYIVAEFGFDGNLVRFKLLV